MLYYSKTVQHNEIASFDSGIVHELYSTFSLVKDAEWSTRLFVLQMKEEDEEGIGTFIHVEHHAPALVGTKIDFTAILDKVEKNEIICSFRAHAGDRLIATGKTGQKILKKEMINRILENIS